MSIPIDIAAYHPLSRRRPGPPDGIFQNSISNFFESGGPELLNYRPPCGEPPGIALTFISEDHNPSYQAIVVSSLIGTPRQNRTDWPVPCKGSARLHRVGRDIRLRLQTVFRVWSRTTAPRREHHAIWRDSNPRSFYRLTMTVDVEDSNPDTGPVSTEHLTFQTG